MGLFTLLKVAFLAVFEGNAAFVARTEQLWSN